MNRRELLKSLAVVPFAGLVRPEPHIGDTEVGNYLHENARGWVHSERVRFPSCHCGAGSDCFCGGYDKAIREKWRETVMCSSHPFVDELKSRGMITFTGGKGRCKA